MTLVFSFYLELAGHMKTGQMFTLPSTTNNGDRFYKIKCVVEKAKNDPRLRFFLILFHILSTSVSMRTEAEYFILYALKKKKKVKPHFTAKSCLQLCT